VFSRPATFFVRLAVFEKCKVTIISMTTRNVALFQLPLQRRVVTYIDFIFDSLVGLMDAFY